MSWPDRRSLHQKISNISILLIAITLPFHILLCSYAATLFVLNQIASGELISNIRSAVKNKWVLLFSAFYLLHIAGLAYSQDLSNGLFDLEKKVSLLIFPLLLFSVPINPSQFNKILLAFVAACFVLSMIFLSAATYNFLETGDPESFLFHHLAGGTGIHRVYASMYLLFCVYILIYFHHKNSVKIKYSSAIYFFLIVYFIVFILLLASRMIFSLTIISFIIISASYFTKKNKTLGISMFLIVISLCTGLLIVNERIRTIMKETYYGLDQGNSEANFTGPNMRIQIWKSAFQVIIENPLGVGTGDVEQSLYEQYVKNDFRWGIQDRFNAHNQYLQTQLGLGLPGIILLLVCFFLPAYHAWQNQHYLYLGFLMLFSISCLSEAMLCTQKGIVFYAFFNSLLAFHYPGKNP